MRIYDYMKRAFQETVGPDLEAPRREIRRLDGRIMDVETKILHLEGKIAGIDAKIISADAKLIRLHTEMVSMKAEILAEIRRLAGPIDQWP